MKGNARWGALLLLAGWGLAHAPRGITASTDGEQRLLGTTAAWVAAASRDSGAASGEHTDHASQAVFERGAEDAFYARDYPRCKRELDAGLPAYPDSRKLWTFRAKYYFFNAADGDPHRMQLALEAAARAAALEPQTARSHVNLAWIYQYGTRDCRQALLHYERGESYGEQEPAVYFQMARCHEALGSNAQAVRYYRQYVVAAPAGASAAKAQEALRRLAKESAGPTPAVDRKGHSK
jgi:tetratricopeptide (TPR) repeat protein